MKYLSKYRKTKQNKDLIEENMILKSKYKPNDYVLYRNAVVKLMYSEVRNDELNYLAIHRDLVFWLPERLIA